MSFFDSTAAGKTINRFSQDLQLIDTELPYNLLGTVTQSLGAVGQCGIIIYGAPWSGLAIPVVAAAVYWLQHTYLSTSRRLRVLEIEAKAPLFSHFLETLSGLATIRAPERPRRCRQPEALLPAVRGPELAEPRPRPHHRGTRHRYHHRRRGHTRAAGQ